MNTSPTEERKGLSESIIPFEIIEGLTMQQWIDRETRKRITTFWATEHEIQPAICSKIFGDGLQLAYLGTINQRPHYWLIRIDSKTDLEAEDFDFESLLQPLEEDFGRHPGFLIDRKEFFKLKKSKEWSNRSRLDEFSSFSNYQAECNYPSIWWDGGFWGSVVNFGTGIIGE